MIRREEKKNSGLNRYSHIGIDVDPKVTHRLDRAIPPRNSQNPKFWPSIITEYLYNGKSQRYMSITVKISSLRVF